MTAPDVVELGRRAVACPGWRWVPGMLDMRGRRAVDDREIPVWHDEGKSCEPYSPSGFYESRGDAVPVLTDSATLGALLGLVREAWAADGALAVYAEPEGRREIENGTAWEVYACYPGGRVEFVSLGDSEAEALVRALEAAPVRS